MSSRESIEFQLTGKLPPEQYGLLSAYVTALMAGQTQQPDILLTDLTDQLAEAESLSILAENYNARYLDRVRLPNTGNKEMLLTTRGSSERFFAEHETPKSLSQVRRAWGKLTSHLAAGHLLQNVEDAIAKSPCQCPLEGYVIWQDPVDPQHWKYTHSVGLEPASLYGLAEYAEAHPDGVRATSRTDLSYISPQVLEVINVYLDGLKRTPEN